MAKALRNAALSLINGDAFDVKLLLRYSGSNGIVSG
jgi:hypothetical protein